jgi:hypothetical protein
MRYGDWNAEELKDVEVADLDMRAVLEVATNEAKARGEVNGIDCRALVESYARSYVKDRDILKDVAREALGQFLDNPPVTQAGVTPEFIVGHACAVAAAAHVKADLDLVWDEFCERATEALPDDLNDIKGPVTADRLTGGRMEREYRSEQRCTPQDIHDIVADKVGAEVADRISVDDYEHEAERLMGNFFGIELDYADAEQVVCDLEEIYGGLDQLAQGEVQQGGEKANEPQVGKGETL